MFNVDDIVPKASSASSMAFSSAERQMYQQKLRILQEKLVANERMHQAQLDYLESTTSGNTRPVDPQQVQRLEETVYHQRQHIEELKKHKQEADRRLTYAEVQTALWKAQAEKWKKVAKKAQGPRVNVFNRVRDLAKESPKTRAAIKRMTRTLAKRRRAIKFERFFESIGAAKAKCHRCDLVVHRAYTYTKENCEDLRHYCRDGEIFP
ncbi:hypothetical protein AAVH_22798 [Aphelenchoides avenae]|nr:hypothetical protein AAVH_22798 [Aphelenchus avenae]